MSKPAVSLLDGVIPVVPWDDPIVDSVGHDLRSPYAERFWLPVLGPSTLLLLRRLAERFAEQPTGFELDVSEAAAELGMGSLVGRNGAFANTLARTVQFGAATTFGGGLAVRRRLPFLPDRHVIRLTEPLRAAHAAWLSHDDRMTRAALRRRALSLALTLVRLGENDDDVRWQLSDWRFPDDLIEEALDWARTHEAPAEAA
jgi:hypothetical protein